MNRQWSPYIPLCITYFVPDMLRINYTIEETPSTVDAFLMIDVITSYLFVNYYMCRHQWADSGKVKKELAKYVAVRPSVEAETLA